MLDLAIAAYLILVLPGFQLWRSLKARRSAAQSSKARKYFRTIGLALAPSAAVVGIWLISGRSWTALGFGLRTAGIIGLGLAVVVLAGVGFVMRSQMTAPNGPPKEALEILPTKPEDRIGFLAMTTIVSVAWELLYRGYLLWVLTPRLGLILAVVAAAAAYGLAHGYKSPRQLIGSLVSAMAFTTAFAVSHSLWWLMLIHAGLPILMLLTSLGAPSGPSPDAELKPSGVMS